MGTTVTAGKTFGVVESVKVSFSRGWRRELGLRHKLRLLWHATCQAAASATGCSMSHALPETAPLSLYAQAASDVYSPVSGTVLEINETLKDEPGTVNSSPFQSAWMMKVKMSKPAEAAALLDSKAYAAHCEEGGH